MRLGGAGKGDTGKGKDKSQASDAVPAWTTGGNAPCAVASAAVCAVMSDRPVKVKK